MDKLISTRHILSLLCLLVFGLFVQSCTRVEDVLDKTNVILDTDILNHLMSVQYVTPEGVEPTLEVDIIGPDSDKILSVLGEANLKADANMVNLAVQKTVKFDENAPLQFTLVVKAEGYLPSFRPYTVIDERLDVRTVELVKADNPIEGVSVVNNNLTRNAEQTIEVSTTKGEKATIKVKGSTKMFADNGTEIEGNVKASILYTDADNADMYKMFPGGFVASNALAVGNLDAKVEFQPLGLLSIDMFAGNKEVKTFSEALEVKVPLSNTLINPVTEEAIQTGDQLAVMSYNEKVGEWQVEQIVSVQEENGQMFAAYEQNHLSFWSLAGVGTPCSTTGRNNVFNFSIIYIKSNFDFDTKFRPVYYIELVNVATGKPITPEGINTELYNGKPIVLFAPPAVRARVFIYKEKGGELLDVTRPINLCRTVNDLRVDELELVDIDNADLKINVAVAGRCASGLEVRPTLPIFFRPSAGGNNPYSLLGVLESGRGSTTALKIGRSYDFRMAVGGLVREALDLQVPQNDTEIEIFSPVYNNFMFTVNINYEMDADGNRILNLTYLDVEVPAKACREYREFFLSGN